MRSGAKMKYKSSHHHGEGVGRRWNIVIIFEIAHESNPPPKKKEKKREDE